MVSPTVAVAPLAKNVVVLRNGDPFFLGRKFVVSQRRFLTFDAFLNEVTSTIHAPLAVRSIYTPRGGRRVTELSELQNGCRYVAAGFERFKRLETGEVLSRVRVEQGSLSKQSVEALGSSLASQGGPGPLNYDPTKLMMSIFKQPLPLWGYQRAALSTHIQANVYANAGMKQLNKPQKKNGAQNYPGTPQKVMVTAGWKRQTSLPCVIHVFRNGDLLSPPFRMVLPREALREWGTVLDRLSEKANLRTGPVKKLCKLNGDLISQGEELVNGEYYVAVGLEKYKDLPYFELLVPPKIPLRPFWNFPTNRRRNYNRRVASEDRASDSALLEPVQQMNLWRVHSTGIVPAGDPPRPSGSKPAKRYPHQDKATSVFHARPSQVGQERRLPGNYFTPEEGSIYKKRGARQEVADAQEIGEDEDTQVELPVDQKTAEIVEEELVSKTKGGPSKKCF